MALTFRTFADLFGAFAGGAGIFNGSTPPSFTSGQYYLAIKVNELGTLVTGTGSGLTAEGVVLALLQQLNSTAGQGTDAARAITVSKSTPVTVTRGGDPVQGERYSVTVYDPTIVGGLDPDDIHP